ncbi:phospholipase domain-containing protein, partial [Kitasatospora sp. MBT63]|uniref:phospholipase domain-containing protein n=1 Tax=Kitasatospora sp. MBT63 TaxID=1444768 RepID=UPI001E6542C0
YAFAGTPYTVAAGASKTYTWDANATDGRYDFTVHGPDGFVRRFAGTVVWADQSDVAVPRVTATVQPGGVALQLVNDGATAVSFTVTPNDFGGQIQTVWAPANGRATVTWPLNLGRYDITVTAATGTRFARRYAGTVH